MFIKPLIAALLLAASPGAFALNLVYNPDFDTSLDGWSVSVQAGGGAYRESYFGSPDSGTLRLDAYNFGNIAEAWQCVDLHAWTDMKLDVVLRFAQNTFAGTGFYQFKLDVQDAADCGGNTLTTIYINGFGDPVPGANGSTWTESSVYGTDLPGGTLSGKLYFGVAAGAAGTSGFMIDHVQVGPLEEIFRETFESN